MEEKTISFKDSRFNPDDIPFHDFAKAMAKAYGFNADLPVDTQIAQLTRLRVAQKNQCSYCVILHTEKAREAGIHSAKIDGISAWVTSRLYTEKERAVLTYSDALCKGYDDNFQEKHDTLAKFYSTKDIATFAAIIINMNVWTRLKLAQGATPEFD